MADAILPGAPSTDDSTLDYLGRPAPLSIRNQPALPAGGPAIGVSGAPATLSGSGAVAGTTSAGGAGSKAASGGPSTLAEIARLLGLGGKIGNLFGGKGGGGTPSVSAPATSAGASLVDPASTGFQPGGLTAHEQMGIPATGTSPEDSTGGMFFDPSRPLPASTLDEIRQALIERGLNPSDYGLAAEAEGGAAEAGASGTGGWGTGLGIGGAVLQEIGTLTGNKDVSRAGQAATAAGSAAEVGAGLAGAGTAASVFALPALAMSGMQLAQGLDQEAQVARDTRNVKDVMRNKVPGAIGSLQTALSEAHGVSMQSPTEALQKALADLEGARQQFNAVDHAFKGGLTIAGKPVNTGLTLDQMQPYIQALNLTQMRIEDELGRRGVTTGAGVRSARDWLPTVSPDAYQQFVAPTMTWDPESHTSSAWEDPPGDPAFRAELDTLTPGHVEEGIMRLLRAQGLTPTLPGFGSS